MVQQKKITTNMIEIIILCTIIKLLYIIMEMGVEAIMLFNVKEESNCKERKE